VGLEDGHILGDVVFVAMGAEVIDLRSLLSPRVELRDGTSDRNVLRVVGEGGVDPRA